MPNRARTDVTDNHAESRYEIRVDGELAGFARYRVDGDRQVFLDTQVDPLHRGKGLGQRLAGAALQDVRANGRTVEARCEFIADYIREHPEHLDLVACSSDQAPRPVA
jgi:predicted GNAT family acetyltransferase